MKDRAILIAAFLLNCFAVSSQTAGDFIREYKKIYAEKQKSVYVDSTLTYIPAVMNIGSNRLWYRDAPSTRRQLFWSYLIPPKLADNEAVRVTTRQVFHYPMGILKVASGEADTLQEIKGYRGDIYSLLIDYLRDNPYEYVFYVINLGDNYDGWFWIIQGDKIYVLLRDETVQSFYAVETEYFFSNMADDTFFMDGVERLEYDREHGVPWWKKNKPWY